MDLWQQFWHSGRIDDYLKYKNARLNDGEDMEAQDANHNQRLDNQRTDYWGE